MYKMVRKRKRREPYKSPREKRDGWSRLGSGTAGEGQGAWKAKEDPSTQ